MDPLQHAPAQGKMYNRGLEYLESEFPLLDYITGCNVTWQQKKDRASSSSSSESDVAARRQLSSSSYSAHTAKSPAKSPANSVAKSAVAATAKALVVAAAAPRQKAGTAAAAAPPLSAAPGSTGGGQGAVVTVLVIPSPVNPKGRVERLRAIHESWGAALRRNTAGYAHSFVCSFAR